MTLDFDELDRAAGVSAAPRALRSLYGYGERPQEILTPMSVLAPLLAEWGSIELDPCACDASIVPAAMRYYGPPRDAGGLVLPWLDRTYCNPPFKDLKAWLARAREESMRGLRIAVLAPVRTHRAWFRNALDSATRVQWLDPVKFVGYDQAFPAPLCLLRWG